MVNRYLVLANSRKEGGRCVAVVDEEGNWLRPVSGVGTGELMAGNCVHAGGGRSLLPLDVVAAEFGARSPTPYQPEDHIQPISWEEPDWITPTELTEWLDRAVDHEADFLTRGRVDRISEISASEEPLQSSLALVQPSSLKIVKTQNYKGNPQVRAVFMCDGVTNQSGEPIQFDLVVTDDAYAARVYGIAGDEITVPVGLGEAVYLTLSLGVPFGGYHYKLVAAVITEQEVTESHGRAGVYPF